MNPAGTSPRAKSIAYWTVTALFCLQMGFTAYAQLSLPQVAQEFSRLGFPAYFRVELSWAKFLGLAVILAPVPARLKEWAYAGFAIVLVSAVIAHVAIGEGPQSWSWAAGTSVLWALSYGLWRNSMSRTQSWGRIDVSSSDPKRVCDAPANGAALIPAGQTD